MSKLPNDPVMLLSVVNTALRDHYSSLDELVANYDTTSDELISKLSAIDYHYDSDTNQFK